MSQMNFKEIAYNNKNNRKLSDFTKKGDNSSTKDVINQLIDEIQEYVSEENKDSNIIYEIQTGKKEKKVLENIIDDFLSQNEKAQGFPKEQIKKKIVDVMVGWERLQPLIESDEKITEISTNEDLEVIKRIKGQDILTNISFESDEELEQFIKNISIRTGEKINRDKCIMDGYDPVYNIRINAGIYGSPIRKGEVVRKPYFTLRLFPKKQLTADDLIRNGTFNTSIYKFFKEIVEDSTIVIVGEPEAGKTTLLDILQGLKDKMRRTIIIQEEPELKNKNKNSVSFVTRKKASDEDNRKTYDMAEFAKIATRLAGKDVVIGEVRDKEAWWLYRLIDMGYKAIYTIHGSSCKGGLEQTQFLMSLVNPNMTYSQLMKKVCDSIDFVIYISNKKVIDIAEVRGYDRENEEPSLNYIFRLRTDKNNDFYWKEGSISEEFKEQLKLRKKLKERRV